METNNQKPDQENPSKLSAFACMFLCLLLTSSFIPAHLAADNEATTAASQLEGSGRMNEERLHPQSTVHVLRLPTTSSR